MINTMKMEYWCIIHLPYTKFGLTKTMVVKVGTYSVSNVIKILIEKMMLRER